MNFIRGTQLHGLENANRPFRNLIALGNESGPVLLAERGAPHILDRAALPLGLGQRANFEGLRHAQTPLTKVLKQNAVVGDPATEHLHAGQRAQGAAEN